MAKIVLERQSLIELIPSVLKLKRAKLWIDYDEEADVLYISFHKPQNANDSIMEDDIVYHYRDDELVGVTILHASDKAKSS